MRALMKPGTSRVHPVFHFPFLPSWHAPRCSDFWTAAHQPGSMRAYSPKHITLFSVVHHHRRPRPQAQTFMQSSSRYKTGEEQCTFTTETLPHELCHMWPRTPTATGNDSCNTTYLLYHSSLSENRPQCFRLGCDSDATLMPVTTALTTHSARPPHDHISRCCNKSFLQYQDHYP